MSQITNPPSSGPGFEERMTRRNTLPAPVKKVLLALASLRVTVVLFVLSLVLVFCGTLAQRDTGIWTVVNQYFRGDWKTAGFVWIPFKNLVFVSVPGSFPFPGGYLLGGALMVNLLAAHAVRFRLTWKRSGVLVLHAGLLLMMVGEFITRQYALEGNMTINADGSSSFLEHQTLAELAVVDPSGEKTDDVVVVPGSMLRRGGTIQHPDLPFDVEAGPYMVNSKVALAPDVKGPAARAALAAVASDGLVDTPPGGPNPATAGLGRDVVAVARPEGAGADPNQRIDMPAAYVTLRKKGGEPLGTYLFSLWLAEQPVTVDGKTYEVSLRFKRTYKPYTVHLLEFKHDRYDRTDVAKNFSSLVRLDDPSRGVSRQTLIYMNNPLRYEGETFYQAGFLPGDTGTILQVVRNPGWQLPYWSCALVALGMLFHFGLTLTTFLRKQLASPAVVPVLTPADEGGSPPEEQPVLAALPGPHGAGQITARPAPRGTAPGRFTAAKNRKLSPAAAPAGASANGSVAASDAPFACIFPWAVLVLGLAYFLYHVSPPSDLAGKMRLEEFARLPVQHSGRIKPLDTVARNSLMAVSDRQTFRDEEGRSHTATEWLLDQMTYVFFENRAAEKVQVVRIENDQVLGFLGLEARPGFRYSIAELKPKMQKIEEEARKAEGTEEGKRDLYAVKIIDLARRLHIVMRLMEMSELGVMPPATGTTEWPTLAEAARAARRSGERDPAFVAYTTLLSAYARHDARGFNKALDEYHAEVDTQAPKASSKAGAEFFFNNFAPFYHCALLYIVVFLLGCLSWVGWGRPLGRAAYLLALLTLVVHTAALIGRIYITGRPPVTNLYSSAIFIGWVGVVVSLALEPLFRLRICTVVAAVGGATTMFIAHLLATGDTMENLVAVLDTNFWLGTHVVCVTIGYAATYLAGLFGMGYLLYGGLRLFNPSLDRSVLKVLSQTVYGIVCFATLFSFVGTVLGGIWADQSWGRFWGWDPKENGALLIVIWNALILHARWAGLARERGVALLAVVGNIITSWSWFGTNLLGVGLHNYGFMHGAFWGLIGAVTFFLLWLVGGLVLPKRVWR